MNISITPELEKFVQSKVESGMYSSASEVIREALRLLSDQEYLLIKRREQLDFELQKGLDSLAQGRVVSSDEVKEHMKKVKAEFFRNQHGNV